MSDSEMQLGPACPHCGRRIPFSKWIWTRGRPFDCPVCGGSIVVPKVSGFPVTSIFVVIMIFVRDTPVLRNNYWLTLLLLLVAGFFEYWFFTSVKDASVKEPRAEP